MARQPGLAPNNFLHRQTLTMECPVCLRDSERLPFFLYDVCPQYALRIQIRKCPSLGTEGVPRAPGGGDSSKSRGTIATNSQRGGKERTATSDNSSRRWALETCFGGYRAVNSENERNLGSRRGTQKLSSKRSRLRSRGGKADIAQRRSNLAAAKAQISERRVASQSTLEKSIKRTDHLWGSIHAQTAEARSFLCHEAAIYIWS